MGEGLSGETSLKNRRQSKDLTKVPVGGRVKKIQGKNSALFQTFPSIRQVQQTEIHNSNIFFSDTTGKNNSSSGFNKRP